MQSQAASSPWMSAQQPNHHQIWAEKCMIQRIRKPRRVALRNSFHSGLCDSGGPRSLGQAAGSGLTVTAQQGAKTLSTVMPLTQPSARAASLRDKGGISEKGVGRGLSAGSPEMSSEAPSALGRWLRS